MKLTNAKPILLDRELINQGGRGVRKKSPPRNMARADAGASLQIDS
jgi:hypothetical protein